MSKDNELSRRQFLGGVAVGLAAVGLSGCGVNVRPDSNGSTNKTSGDASAASPKSSASAPSTLGVLGKDSLLAISGAEPAALIEKGLSELGGMGQFVKSGNTVVIKANFSFPRKPEEGITTNPELVAAVVKQCLAAGAKAVNVIDYPPFGPTCIDITGTKDAVEKAGGKAYCINSKDYFQEVETGGKHLKNVWFSKDVLNADVFISMPKLKNNRSVKISMSMKNMMGLIWDRGYLHLHDLHSCIAELSHYHKPHLIIMDAINGIIENGPAGPGTVKEWNKVVFGVDPVAVDAYGATIYGIDPNDIVHVTKAAELGVGKMDLSQINVKQVTI